MIESNEKIRANGLSAYLMIGANILFFFAKHNPLINNPFVRSHTKSALVIHLYFALVL
jgi:hypothetical protein